VENQAQNFLVDRILNNIFCFEKKNNNNRETPIEIETKKINPDISNHEQMIVQELNEHRSLEDILKNELKELSNDELYLIMRKLKKLGVMDFDIVTNHSNQKPASVFKLLFNKVMLYCKGNASSEKN
jgi:hypothetical protein